MSQSQIKATNQNNTVRRLSYKTIAFNSVAYPSKSSQSLEPVTCVSTKQIPFIPASNKNSVIKMTPSSQYYDSQTKVSYKQINQGNSYYNSGSAMPFQSQKRQQQEFSSFVSNPDNNIDEKSELHIVSPNDQSFASTNNLQINSTIPISQQCSNLTKNGNFQQGQQRNQNTIYQKIPSGMKSESYKLPERSGNNSQNCLPIEIQAGQKSIERQQPQNSQTKEIPIFGQQQQWNCNNNQNSLPQQQIDVKQFQSITSQNQTFNAPSIERSIPALKPSISQQSQETKYKIIQQSIGQFEVCQEDVKRSNPNQNYQIQIQNLQIPPYQYTFEKHSSRGESAPPIIGTSSLSSSIQGVSYQQQYMNSSNNDPYRNSNLNASVFNVIVYDQDEIGEQIKRQRIDSQQQYSISKQQSPEGKKGIQNSTYIDYSYKKSITDKALATQVQQLTNQYYVNDIWNKPPLPLKSKDAFLETQQMGMVSSPQFGAISKPEQQQFLDIYISEAPIIETAVKTISEDPIINNELISLTAYQQEVSSLENNAQIQQSLKKKDQINNFETGDQFSSIEKIVANVNYIPTYEQIEVGRGNIGNTRSNTVEPIKQSKEEPFSPSKLKILEDLRNEKKTRQSTLEEIATPSKLKLLQELRQESKIRQSTFEDSIKRSQKSDNYQPIQNIPVFYQYNNSAIDNKSIITQEHSFSTEPQIGGQTYLSNKFESNLSQLPINPQIKDKQFTDFEKNKISFSFAGVNSTGNLNKEYIDSLLKNYDINKSNQTNNFSTAHENTDLINKNFNLEESVKRSCKNINDSNKKENNETYKNLSIYGNIDQDTSNITTSNPISQVNTTTQNLNSIPIYENMNKCEFNKTSKFELTSTLPTILTQTSYGLSSQNLQPVNIIQPQYFGTTYERQNHHKEMLYSRQNSDQNMRQIEKQQQDTNTNKQINSIMNINSNAFDISQNSSNYLKSYLNQSEIQAFTDEKKKLREVKSVDHLLIYQRCLDPKIEEEVKGWVNPIFEEFIRKNFRDGKFNPQDVQEAIKRSKSFAGFTNGISPVVIEEQLLTLIEQQKKLIDQQNVQIQIQNEVQKSQLYTSSYISSPKIYSQQKNYIDNSTISQGQLNNSHSKSHSYQLNNLPQYENQTYISSGITSGVGNLNTNNYASQFSSNKNNILTGQDAISLLSKESLSGNIYSQYPTKIPNPIGVEFDPKNYQTAPSKNSVQENHHRIISYLDTHDQFASTQNNDQTEFYLTESGNHDNYKNQTQLQYVLISPSNSTFAYGQHSISPQQNQENIQKDQAPIDIKNAQYHDDEMQLEDLTPFNNHHDRDEVELRAQVNAPTTIQEDNEDEDKNSPNLKIHHSKSMGSEQGQEENEYDQFIPNYYSENNSLRDPRDSLNSAQNKKHKKNDPYNSSSPSELTDRDDDQSDNMADDKQIYNEKKRKSQRQNSKITEESYSNKNDGSQQTALNVFLYKQNQSDNYYIEEYTPSKPEIKNNSSSNDAFNIQITPKQEEQRKLSVSESPNENIQTQSSVVHDDDNHESVKSTPQKNQTSKESEDEIKTFGSQNLRSGQDNNFSPLEKVDEDDQEYINKDASANNSTKNSARNNKSDMIGTSPTIKREQNSAGGLKSKIPKSSKSSLSRGKSNDHLKKSQELKKSDSQDSNYELLASEQIKKMRQTLERKQRKDSSQSANSGTYEVFQDIQQHVQDKIKKYDQMSNKKQRESDHVIERLPIAHKRLFSSPNKNLEKVNDQQNVKLSGKVIKKSQDQQKNMKKKEQTIFDILSSKQSSLKKKNDKQQTILNESQSNPQRNKQPDTEKVNLIKQTQNNKKTQEIGKIQKVEQIQKGSTSSNFKSLTSSSKSPEQNKKGGENNQKVFVLHKSMIHENSNQQNTQKNKVNTEQLTDKKQQLSKDKKQSDAIIERKSSNSYQITISQPQNKNKISLTQSANEEQNLRNKQKQLKGSQSINQITITPNQIKQTVQEETNQTATKKNVNKQSIVENNDPNTLNLYQKFQEKKLQEKELVSSQVFSKNRQSQNNMNMSHISQNNEINSPQQQINSPQLKQTEHIYQQNQNLRYQQQQMSNQTKSNTQQVQSYQNQQNNKNQLKKQSEQQAYNQKQREQLERISTRLQQEEEQYQQLIYSQPTNDATSIPTKQGKHLSPTQSEISTSQNFNKLITNSSKDGISYNLTTSQSQQRMMSLDSNNFYTQEGTYTQDYEEYLYQEYIRDQREKLIQKNIKEGVNFGQLTEDQQKYMDDLEKQENRHKFDEFIKRNEDWVQEKERKIREQQQQKADLEMQECTFKPFINQSAYLETKPVIVASTKSSRLLEEQNKLKINSSQNSMNQIPSSKSLRRSNQGSRVGSEAYIQVDGKSQQNMSRKLSNNKLSPQLQPFNTPPNQTMNIQQQERSYSNLDKQGSAELQKDIEDVLGILKNFTQSQN